MSFDVIIQRLYVVLISNSRVRIFNCDSSPFLDRETRIRVHDECEAVDLIRVIAAKIIDIAISLPDKARSALIGITR